MDLTDTIAPRSDQLNADDLMSGPRTITIVEVRRGTDEQPVDVVTQEFGPGRPYKPSKSMRRVMVMAWGPDANVYVGRRLTIYRDGKIRFGREEVGGIRISHLSHIEKVLAVPLTVSKGKRELFKVQPLADEAPKPTGEAVSDEQVADLIALMDRKGCPADKRVATAAWATQTDVARLEELTVNEYALVIDALQQRPDVTEGQP